MSDGDATALGAFWGLVAARLERNGMRPHGRLTLSGLGRGERHALAGLLGRPVSTDRVTVDLAVLDQRIRSSGAGSGLLALVERNVRRPLVDRVGNRRQQRDACQQVWNAGRTELTALGLDRRPWAEPWLEDVRRSGALARLAPERSTVALVTAVHCLAQLPLITGDPMVGRGDVASRVAGDAHALDDGTVLAAVVLRAVSTITAVPYPATPSGRRQLWRVAGVQTDEVSTTVLTTGLRTRAGDAWLDERSAAGWESHLTLRDLRRVDPVPPPGHERVYVCENPRVLEAALDAGCRSPAVCAQGQPSVIVTALVHRLREAGAELCYHGDFDWPGITIANVLIAAHGCTPWRMSAADYLDGLSRLAPMVGDLPILGDVPVAAIWDDELTPAMAAAHRAIHEELLLDDLLTDLA